MRWESFFADLEAQFEAEQRRDLDSEVSDRTRRERAQVSLMDRLTAAVGTRLTVRLVTGDVVEGDLQDIGADWVLLRVRATPRDALVPVAAVVGVVGLGQRAAQETVARRFGLGYAVRALSRDRATVALTDTSGRTLTGTIDRVGADLLDLAEHSAERVRRAENVTGRVSVPFAAIVRIESR